MSQWTQEDAFAGFLVNPQTLNLYPFAGNDPINLVDPTGLSTAARFFSSLGGKSLEVAGICGAIAGGAEIGVVTEPIEKRGYENFVDRLAALGAHIEKAS